jgi:hypothetical protein
MSAPCGSDIPSILELQLRKSVKLTARPIEEPDERQEDDALDRLKALLAEVRKNADRAEALLASLRKPRDYYSPQADGG